ncbi:MAG: tetraacyldisaccharide 4'-kinase [Rhodanobacteraceae bacterium]|nr:MAG: tetraacyldisaccharide 4'-kinase [Rhodanobacteraceae bacterium]
MAIADDLQHRWYEPDTPPAWWTLPLAAFYGSAIGMRRWLYRHRWLRSVNLPVPVIVVGNLVAGGAGKTPLTIALVEGLRTRGMQPGVVSRGYGGTASTPMLLDAQPDPAVVGDEPALIKLRTGAPVAVGVDRPEAARLLLDQGVDVIVADDGLQHYTLARNVEICVVGGARRFGNAHLLPAGPLREPVSRLREVDFIVCNGGEPSTGEVPMSLALGDAVSLREPPRRQPLSAFAGRSVHGVAGIGHPRRFFEALGAEGIRVTGHAFPDHHRHAAHDLDFGDDLPVLMTEKDAVKCRAFAKPGWWSVPATARLPESFFDSVVARLAASRGA